MKRRKRRLCEIIWRQIRSRVSFFAVKVNIISNFLQNIMDILGNILYNINVDKKRTGGMKDAVIKIKK